MTKFILGIVLIKCILVYGADIKRFTVDSETRDKVITYLKSR